jgi:hypothetical protein
LVQCLTHGDPLLGSLQARERSHGWCWCTRVVLPVEIVLPNGSSLAGCFCFCIICNLIALYKVIGWNLQDTSDNILTPLLVVRVAFGWVSMSHESTSTKGGSVSHSCCSILLCRTIRSGVGGCCCCWLEAAAATTATTTATTQTNGGKIRIHHGRTAQSIAITAAAAWLVQDGAWQGVTHQGGTMMGMHT